VGSSFGEISLTSPTISIILATHNTPSDRLQRVLKAIKENTDVPYEFVIVDTSRSPAAVSALASRFNATLLRPPDRGLGAKWNLGAEHTTAPVLAFACDDVYVEPNWASIGIRYLHNRVKLVSGKLLAGGRDGVINAAGSYTDVFGVSWNRGIGERDHGRYDKPELIFRAVGAVFLTERKAFNEVGRFDESYYLYAEDMDLCWRLRLAGYDCMYVPAMRAQHEWMATTSKDRALFAQYYYLLERNRLQTVFKNYSLRALLSIMPWYIVIKAGHLIWLVVHNKGLETRRLFRAFVWIARNRKEILRKRYLAQKLRKRNDHEIQQLMLKLPAELLLGLGFFKHPLVEAARKRD
jgi:GT2 family glycosyltransferase